MPEYKRLAFPECWTQKRHDDILNKLEKRDTAESFLKAMKSLLKWAEYHRKEDVRALCGEHYSQTQKCITRLNRGGWPANKDEQFQPSLEEYQQLNKILAAVGVKRRLLPAFIREQLEQRNIEEIMPAQPGTSTRHAIVGAYTADAVMAKANSSLKIG